MKRSISVILGCASLLLLSSTDARAQSVLSDKLTISVNVGFQVHTQDIAANGTTTIYEEDSTFSTTQSVGNGPIFDIGAEYEFMKNLGVGVNWTWFSDKGPIALTAQVPHPLFSNQFRTATGQANDAKHTESVFNIDLVYRYPFSDKIDLVFYGGPTFASIHQEMASGYTIAPEPGPSFTNPTVDSVSVTEEKKTGVGVNVGADAQYMFTPRFGAGAGLRYTYASADIPGATDKVKAGGFQILGGLRMRF